jgi:enoyl-CoA hydratase/carnithine racemase
MGSIMEKLTTYHFEDEDLKSYPEEEFLIIYLKQNAFEIVTDLSESSHLFDLLERVEKDAAMKGVFIYNHPGCYSEEEYEAYLKRILKIKESEEIDLFTAHHSQSIRKRQINILNQFILNAIKMQKLVIIGLQGCVVTPFFGASLGADLRFVSENMRFSLAHLSFGLHPTGALPYLLPKFIGINRAKDFLFRGGDISAEQALKLGLINQIYPRDTFLDNCLAELKKLQRIDHHLIKITKQLMNTYAGELERYFEFESKISFF